VDWSEEEAGWYPEGAMRVEIEGEELQLDQDLSPIEVDGIQVYLGPAGTNANPGTLWEALDQPASRIFTGVTQDLGEAMVRIATFGGLQVGVVDEMEIYFTSDACFAEELFLTLRETGPDSQVFEMVSKPLTIEILGDPANVNTIEVYLGEMKEGGCTIQKTSQTPIVFAGSTSDLGDVTVEIVRFSGEKPGVRDEVVISLTNAKLAAEERGLTLVELEDPPDSGVFRTRDMVSASGVNLFSLSATVDSLTVEDNIEGTGPGICNPMRVVVESPLYEEGDEITIDGRVFALVEKEGELQADRPVMVVEQTNIPTWAETVYGRNARLRARYGEVEEFVRWWAVDGATDRPKLALGTAGRLYLCRRGIAGTRMGTNPYGWVSDESGIACDDLFEMIMMTPEEHGMFLKIKIKPTTDRSIVYKDYNFHFDPDGVWGPSQRIDLERLFRIVDLKVVILALDGVSADGGGFAPTFERIVRGNDVFGQILGHEYDTAENKYCFRNCVGGIDESYAINTLPTVTFSSWSTIFTGKPPKETGVLGNAFFARDGESHHYQAFACRPIYCLWDAARATSGSRFERGGILNGFLYDGAPTLFKQLEVAYKGNGEIRTASAYALVNKGADHVRIFPSITSALVGRLEYPAEAPIRLPTPFRQVLQAKNIYTLALVYDHGAAFAKAYDKMANDDACALWGSIDQLIPDLTAVYYCGPDAMGHKYGVRYVGEHLVNWVASEEQLGKLYKTIMEKGYISDDRYSNPAYRSLWSSVVFVVVADHGQVTKRQDRVVLGDAPITELCRYYSERVRLHPEEEPIEIPRIYDPILGQWVYPGFQQYASTNSLNDPGTWMVYAPNGGIGHVYLRSNAPGDWQTPPSDALLERIAGLFYYAWLQDPDSEMAGMDPFPDPDEELPGELVGSLQGALGYVNLNEEPPRPVKAPAVLLRTGGFDQPYRWYMGWDEETKQHLSEPLSVLEAARGEEWDNIVGRIGEMNCQRSGDIVLIFDMKAGGWWTSWLGIKEESGGEHGSPSPEESRVPLAFAFKPLQDEELAVENDFVKKAIDWRTEETRRTQDMTPIIVDFINYARKGLKPWENH